MASTAQYNVKDKDLTGSVQDFLKSVLELEEINAILVPQHIPGQNI